MGQKKLIRFEAIKTFGNVLQHPAGMPGRWSSFFEKEQPLTLELACGKGEYSVGLGVMFPERNFLGIDIKGNRLFVGAKKALEIPLHNVGFMRAQIDSIDTYFAPEEVDEIWLTFPDPQLRSSKAKKRLTHPKFLRKYQTFLKKGSLIHLKTDSPVLYTFTKKVIELYGCKLVKCYDDVYGKALEPELLNIKTHYEGLDIAKSGKIFYVQFRLPDEPLPLKDEELKNWVFETETDRGS
ncbi:MAG: tRNA (guanosine(46)-N7)-methyltransferase TrmB [Chitinophagaceae bacterium]|nr:tRNA (guanosine(46)-N7)-methyltransferase TrmB [Chitinophagaceae bacterium]